MNTNIKNILISDFDYDLPSHKIALFPLKERDQSKLLIFKNGDINESTFSEIINQLPSKSLLVFNNSKVINARIKFQKSTGSVIEIFCLEPAGDSIEYSLVMNQKKSAKWKCFVGGVSKWKDEFLEKNIIIDGKNITLRVNIVQQLQESFILQFDWEDESISFAAILEVAGDVPLPPYIKRTTEDIDDERYQTIYALHEGSVAAPTAGLHFTDSILTQTKEKQIKQSFVTLHVGAGTFKPVKATQMADHEMHAEWIDVDIETIHQLMNQEEIIIAVGTTSLRTLETLYWLGVKCLLNPMLENLTLNQWDVYEIDDTKISKNEALLALINWMNLKNTNRIFSSTQLLIVPGYTFKIAKAIITNFHQPKSTLLLLVSAAIGDAWKDCYKYALENDFRFLSYGDANLLFMAE
jgi:S-adenosylmethionine:tRNA ribosyltransferase-isomerase